MKSARALPLILALAPLGACSSTVSYVDPDEVEILSKDFSYSDLKMIAQDLTNSFLATGVWGNDVPRIAIGGVVNRSNQHIDTVNITDTIETVFVQSGKFSVLAPSGDHGLDELEKELSYQQSGKVDQAAAVELGKQLGAEYVFYGRFTTMEARADGVESVAYKMTFKAINVTTRQLVWTNESVLRKREEKATIGW